MGKKETGPTTPPSVLPALQNRGVISVVLGDYHFGALLEDGTLLAWGAATNIGMGDPYSIEPGKPGGFRSQEDKNRAISSFVQIPDVLEPTKVRFDHGLAKPRDTIVFGVTAAGWHMGALVIDSDEVM